jgi:hypothetical protein
MRAPAQKCDPAYPVVAADGTTYRGVTTRDYFAAQAMLVAWALARARLMSTGCYSEATAEQAIRPEILACEAYRIADAMLAERGGA